MAKSNQDKVQDDKIFALTMLNEPSDGSQWVEEKGCWWQQLRLSMTLPAEQCKCMHSILQMNNSQLFEPVFQSPCAI